MISLENQPPNERLEIQGPDGLTLKQLVPDDAQSYFDALHHDPSRFQYGEESTLRKYQTVEQVQASITDPDPNRLRLGVWDADKLVATVNLQFSRPHSAELGYWSGYGCKDYSERGARLLISYAFSNYDIDKITAWAADNNIGSRKVLERLGFKVAAEGLNVFYELNKPSEINRPTP